MDLVIGDKVKFLNAKGGGIVSRIIDSRMVNVAVEGGFEIPTLISELVKVDEQGSAARFFGTGGQVEHVERFGQAEREGNEETDENKIIYLPASIKRNRKSEEIFLVYLPHDQKWLITGLLDVMLINNSSFDILYNLFLENPDGGFAGKDYGSCFPDSILLLDTITREQLTEWTTGYLQFLFHKSALHEVLPPFNSQYKVSGQKFYNDKSYREIPFLTGKAILVKVVSISEYYKITEKQEGKVPAKKNLPEDEILINKHKVNPREAEVDLHIHELIEDPGLLESQEILDFQKNYFQKMLNSAILNHFLKVTFIHGVGNGILREAILDILKNYDNLQVFDAPMEKYGAGAIEVRIPHNQ